MQQVWGSLKRALSITEVNRTLLLLLITLVIYIVNPFFYTAANLRLIMIWGSIFSLMVLGQMLYLIPGGMDLAFGGVICIVNILAAILIKNFHVNTWLAVIVGPCAGLPHRPRQRGCSPTTSLRHSATSCRSSSSR